MSETPEATVTPAAPEKEKAKPVVGHHPEFADFQSPHEASVDKLVDALDRAYHRPGLLAWRAFMQGFMSAIGATIGTVVILFAIGLLLHLLGGVRLFAPLVDRIQQSIVQGVATQQYQIDQQLRGITPTASPTPVPTVTPLATPSSTVSPS